MEDQFELRLQAWEMGLPSPEDLTPLSQSLISPQLALAFGITTQDNNNSSRAHFDLNRVMHDEDNNNNNNINNCFDSFNLRLFPGRTSSDYYKRGGPDYFGPDEANSGSTGDETGLNRAVKRPRLVWTPKLHKRFVDVIEHLGIDKAVPKTIMEMMNVDGLTRENVASHLQKYRLYLKRVEGGVPCSEGYSSSSSKRDPPFFDCEGFSGNFALSQQQQQQGLFCSSVNMMQMPMVGPPGPGYGGGGGYGHLGLNVGSSNPSGYCGLESGGYSVFWNRQRG